MEKKFRISKMLGILIMSSMLLIPVSIATAANQPPSGYHFVGPAIIADMYFTAESAAGVGICQGSTVSIEILITITQDMFDDINKENLLDQYLELGTQIKVLKDGVKADCVPEDAVGMVIKAVPDFFADPDGTSKTAKVIVMFVTPK